MDRQDAVRALRVGAVLGPRPGAALRDEWRQTDLTRDNWQDVITGGIDLLLVSGSAGAWPAEPGFRRVVNLCRAGGVATAYWSDVEPTHVRQEFAVAELFDKVYVASRDRLGMFRARFSPSRVDSLPPAANPPARAGGLRLMAASKGCVLVAGEPEPFGTDLLADGAAVLKPGGPATREVARLRPAAGWAARARSHRVALVPGDPRQIPPELMDAVAHGVPVLTTAAAAKELFDEREVLVAPNQEEATNLVNALLQSPELRDRAAHLAARRLWEGHTWRRRAQTIAWGAGLAPSPQPPRTSVTIMTPTNRPWMLQHVIDQAGRQVGVDAQMVLLAHGFEPDRRQIAAWCAAAGLENVLVTTAPESITLGECYQILIGMADGDVLAKVDDDDLYGPHYLSDQVHALDHTGAELVGKRAYHVRLEELGWTVLRFPTWEHRWAPSVAGGTFTMRRATAVDVGFSALPRAVDTDFINRLTAAGGKIYSSDRYNYIGRRLAGVHTWSASHRYFLATGLVKYFGDATGHIIV
ncbi:MAG: glycosyltransferase [Bifidobacteriaceae bacterium]|jgi:hypothetical protein|nr:glycosyltransferase [Bifidobacteriaceae bacterium]